MITLYNDLVRLCDRIENQWQKINYSSEDFYKVAWERTGNIDLSPLGEVSNQMKMLSHPMVRLNQTRSTFSDLYFQIYNNGRFMIEILNWAGSHVNVHDHDFSGVQFQLKGDALNVVYDFDRDDENHGALRFGELKVREAKIWKEGGRSMVRGGDVDPHCVFHLGQPTTSLLIRTLPTPRMGSQSNYFPTLAAHYTVNTDLQRKKLTGLNLLSKQNPKAFRECFMEFVDNQSLAENFFMMLKLGPRLFTDDTVDLIQGYAARGENESKVVRSVVYNNAIDFFKTRANQISRESQEERLAIFAIAAATSRENMTKLAHDLSEQNVDLQLPAHLSKFSGKLQAQDRVMAEKYFNIFGIERA